MKEKGARTGAPEKVASGEFLVPWRDSGAKIFRETERVPPRAPFEC